MLRTSIGSLVVLLGVLAASAGDADAQNPPTPYQLVSQLDFECRPAHGPQVANGVVVRQLNPVLKDKIPNLFTPLGELEEVCVPVAKNGQLPSPAAAAFIRWLDVACYRAAGPYLGVDVKVSHLNPVLAGLPDEDVKLAHLEQVCLPVAKNASQLPAPAKKLASHFDLGCYGLEEPTAPADLDLVLTHLNPVIRAMELPDRTVHMEQARQLCVPIGKDAQPVPVGVRDLVEWADFLKYRVVPDDEIPPLDLWLRQLNPLYAGQDPFFTTLQPDRIRLMVPVAKDDHLPPGEH